MADGTAAVGWHDDSGYVDEYDDDYDGDDDGYGNAYGDDFADDYAPAAARGGGGGGRAKAKAAPRAPVATPPKTASAVVANKTPAETLTPAHVMLKRLQALPAELSRRCEVGYDDRFAGVLYTSVHRFASATDAATNGGVAADAAFVAVPMHRVVRFRACGHVLWDREARSERFATGQRGSGLGACDGLFAGVSALVAADTASAVATEVEQRLANLTAALAANQIRRLRAGNTAEGPRHASPAACVALGPQCTVRCSESNDDDTDRTAFDAALLGVTWGDRESTKDAGDGAAALQLATVARTDDLTQTVTYTQRALETAARHGALFDGLGTDVLRCGVTTVSKRGLDADDASGRCVVVLRMDAPAAIALAELRHVVAVAVAAGGGPGGDTLDADVSSLALAVRMANPEAAERIASAPHGAVTLSLRGVQLKASPSLLPPTSVTDAPAPDAAAPRLVAAFALNGTVRSDVAAQAVPAIRERGPDRRPLPPYVPSDALEAWLCANSDLEAAAARPTHISQRGGMYALSAAQCRSPAFVGVWRRAIAGSDRVPFFVEEVRGDRFRLYLDVDVPLRVAPESWRQEEHEAAIVPPLLNAIWAHVAASALATPPRMVAFRCFGPYDDASPEQLPVRSKLGLRLYFPTVTTTAADYPALVRRLGDALDRDESVAAARSALREVMVRRGSSAESLCAEVLDADHAGWDRNRLVGSTKRRRVQHFDRRYRPHVALHAADMSATPKWAPLSADYAADDLLATLVAVAPSAESE